MKITVVNILDQSKGVYKYNDMPAKYVSVYKYAFEVLNLIKSKIPKVKLENKKGRFFLMMNEPHANFEAFFSTGDVIKHTVSTDTILLTVNNMEKQLNLYNGEIDKLEKDQKDEVQVALHYLQFCLQEE
jgi:hypothetical protein